MQDLTSGSLARNVLKMSSFMLVSMVFQTLYFLVDLYLVGRLVKEAVAAVSVSGNLTSSSWRRPQTLGVGTTSLISQAVGRKETATRPAWCSTIAGAVGGRGVAVPRDPDGTARELAALAADAATAALAGDYLAWFMPAMACSSRWSRSRRRCAGPATSSREC